MANFGKRWLPCAFIVPAASTYDITAVDADIDTLKTTMDGLGTEMYLDSASGDYELADGLTITPEDGKINNTLDVEELFTVTCQVMGLDATGDATKRATLKGVNTGGLYNLYVFDDKQTTEGIVYEIKNCKVRAKRSFSEEGKEFWDIEAKQLNGGDVTTRILPNTYSA